MTRDEMMVMAGTDGITSAEYVAGADVIPVWDGRCRQALVTVRDTAGNRVSLRIDPATALRLAAELVEIAEHN